MVIERAIEKLKKSGGVPDADPRLRARARDALGGKPKVAIKAPPPEHRLAFPSVALDPTVLERNRVIDPSLASSGALHGSSPFRMLRSRLLNKIRAEGWTTVAITSPGAGEGKTLVSINLALSIAREGSSDVFLLDFDMRNPSVCRYLGVTPRREIVDYFSDDLPAEELFFSAGSERLSIAGGLVSTENASEHVASLKVEGLVAYIRSVAHNPLILFDLPPMLVSDEAIVLAPRVDAVALVIAEGRSNRDGLVRAKQLLDGHSLAGVILNRSTDAPSAANYYGYSYGYRGQTPPNG